MNYYVYAYLRRDGVSPYYIGKGTGNRWQNKGGRNCQVPPRDRVVFIKENMSEADALELERMLILMWGRKEDGGVLQNIQEGGKQPPSRLGCPQPNTEQLRRLLKGNKHAAGTTHRRGAKMPVESYADKCKKVRINGVVYQSGHSAARHLGVGRSTINQWVSKGKAEWVR